MKLKTNELTTKELVVVFGVSAMTITNWRSGSKRISPLPYHLVNPSESGRCNVVYKLGELKTWATKNHILYSRVPQDVIEARRKKIKEVGAT